jgi:hypothetical protein
MQRRHPANVAARRNDGFGVAKNSLEKPEANPSHQNHAGNEPNNCSSKSKPQTIAYQVTGQGK